MLAKRPALLLLSAVALHSVAGAAVTNAKPQIVTICRSAAVTREIRTYHTMSGGCRVDYVKGGEARTLWRAASDRQYCAAQTKVLVDALTRGNFSCDTSGIAAAEGSIPPVERKPHEQSRSMERSTLTEFQIGAANRWLQQRVASLSNERTVRTGPDARRYASQPDFLAAADVDADGRTDLIVGWGWASFRCDGTYLTVLINDADDVNPTYRPAEVELPGDCGAKGWLSSVKDVKDRRIHIQLQQRYPGSDNVQQIAASVRHDGVFTFFGPSGGAGTLAAIVQGLPLKSE